jgi:hypothetical protein
LVQVVKKLKNLGDEERVKWSKAIADAFSKGDKQQWSIRRHINTEEDVLKKYNKQIRQKFSIPDDMELTHKFVELLGLYQHEHERYDLSILAAKGGSQVCLFLFSDRQNICDMGCSYQRRQ